MRLRDRPAMVWLDPPGSMVKDAFAYAIRYGLTPRTLTGEPLFIYDCVAETSNVPGYPVIVPSSNPDPDQREAEDQNIIEEVKALLVQAEGKLNTQASPITDKGLTDALELFTSQRKPKDFTKLHRCFRHTQERLEFVRDCTNPQVVQQFEIYAELGDKDWEYRCGPAVRRLEKIARSVQFRKRCIPTFDLRAFLNRGGILMLDGESRGNLSRESLTLVMALVLLNVLQLARNGLTRRVVIIIDEARNANLLDLNVARALLEAGKWGVEFDILTQNPQHPNPEVSDSLFQACDRVMAFKQVNPGAVKFMADMFSQPTYDPMEVWYEEDRVRFEDETQPEKLDTESVSVGPGGDKRVTTGFTYRTKKRQVIDKVTHYKSGDAQDREKQQQLASLRPGQCLIIDGQHVTEAPVQLPMLPRPWEGLWFTRTEPRVSLADRKRELALELMRQRPEYRSPVSSEPLCPPPPSTDDAADRLDAGEL